MAPGTRSGSNRTARISRTSTRSRFSSAIGEAPNGCSGPFLLIDARHGHARDGLLLVRRLGVQHAIEPGARGNVLRVSAERGAVGIDGRLPAAEVFEAQAREVNHLG